MKIIILLLSIFVSQSLYPLTCGQLITDITQTQNQQDNMAAGRIDAQVISSLGDLPLSSINDGFLSRTLDRLRAEKDLLNMVSKTLFSDTQTLKFSESGSTEVPRVPVTFNTESGGINMATPTEVAREIASGRSGDYSASEDVIGYQPGNATAIARERNESRVLQVARDEVLRELLNGRITPEHITMPVTPSGGDPRAINRDEFLGLYINRQCGADATPTVDLLREDVEAPVQSEEPAPEAAPATTSGQTPERVVEQTPPVHEVTRPEGRQAHFRLCDFSDADIATEAVQYNTGSSRYAPSGATVRTEVRNMVGNIYNYLRRMRTEDVGSAGQIQSTLARLRALIHSTAAERTTSISDRIRQLDESITEIQRARREVRASSQYQLLEEFKTALSRHAVSVCGSTVQVCDHCNVDPRYLTSGTEQFQVIRNEVLDRNITAVSVDAPTRELRSLCRTTIARETAAGQTPPRYRFPSCQELVEEGDSFARASDRYSIMRQATGGYEFNQDGSVRGTRARSGWDAVASYGAPSLVIGGLQAFGVNMMTNVQLPYWVAQGEWQKTYLFNQQAITDYQQEFWFNYYSNLPTGSTAFSNVGYGYNFGYANMGTGGSFFTVAP